MVFTIGSIVKDDKNNEYILDSFLGHGGFGTVYKARRLSDDLIVAVKTLQTSFGNKNSLLSFQREAMQSNLITSDYVIKYFYVHDGDTFPEYPPYIIMEYANEGSLFDLIKKQQETGKLFDLSFIIDSFSQLANGMKAISEMLVHRDIKPENILIKDGILKISDFGLSKLRDNSTQTYTLKGYGSAKYVAPEAWDNDKNTTQMDIYSMGIVFYELATLKYPYNMNTDGFHANYRDMHLYNAINNPNIYNPELPQNLVSMIIQMLEKSTHKRLASWDTVISALQVDPLPNNSVSNILKTALNIRNSADIRLQQEQARKKRIEQEKSDHCRLVYSQYENDILSPIRDFITRFNEQYTGNEQFNLNASRWNGQENFSYKIVTPSKKSIHIDSEIILAQNHIREVRRDIFFSDTPQRKENYIPQCKNKDILAWSRVSDDDGRGFNILLLKETDSLYGNWFLLKNTNSGFAPATRMEPFGFTLTELPKEILYINATHIYSSEFLKLNIDDILSFLAERA